MSFILDALKRAQAERDRGNVPGLHSAPAWDASAPSGTHPGKSGAGKLLGVTVVVAAVAGLAWWQLAPRWLAGPKPSEVVVLNAPVAAPAVVAPASAPAPAPAPASTPQPPAVAPQVIDVTPPPAPVAPPPQVAAAPKPKASAPAMPSAASAGAAPAAEIVPPAPATQAAASGGPVYAVANLPPSVRDQLPNLQLAGITYSSNARYRMVIVNGQVLHEGDSAGPGLVLDRIESARTIWSFRGYRYALP